MSLIHRVMDVCSFVEVQDPDDEERSRREPRSCMFRWLNYQAKQNPGEVTQDTVVEGATLAELGGEWSDVTV